MSQEKICGANKGDCYYGFRERSQRVTCDLGYGYCSYQLPNTGIPGVERKGLVEKKELMEHTVRLEKKLKEMIELNKKIETDRLQILGEADPGRVVIVEKDAKIVYVDGIVESKELRDRVVEFEVKNDALKKENDFLKEELQKEKAEYCKLYRKKERATKKLTNIQTILSGGKLPPEEPDADPC